MDFLYRKLFCQASVLSNLTFNSLSIVSCSVFWVLFLAGFLLGSENRGNGLWIEGNRRGAVAFSIFMLLSVAFLQQRTIRIWTNFFGILNCDNSEIELVSHTYLGDPNTGYKIMPSNKLITESKKKELFYPLDFFDEEDNKKDSSAELVNVHYSKSILKYECCFSFMSIKLKQSSIYK